MENCGYCNKLVTDSDSYFDCIKCQKKIHSKCLRRGSPPSGLLGDTFYKFSCFKCSTNNSENFEREGMSCMTAIVLALHNLSIQNQGISFYGYFHFKTNIAYFIERHWNILFNDPKKKRIKKWLGCISGCLSHNSPELFVSGTQTVGDPGWWRLSRKNWTPRKYYDYCEYH